MRVSTRVIYLELVLKFLMSYNCEDVFIGAGSCLHALGFSFLVATLHCVQAQRAEKNIYFLVKVYIVRNVNSVGLISSRSLELYC